MKYWNTEDYQVEDDSSWHLHLSSQMQPGDKSDQEIKVTVKCKESC